MTEQITLIVLLVPLAWSALVVGARRLTGNPTPNDRGEKYQLLIMVTPILLGAVWIVLAPILSLSLPLPLPPLDDSGPSAAMVHTVARPGPAKAAFDPKPWLMDVLLGAWGLGALIRLLPLGIACVRLDRTVRRAGKGEIGGAGVRLTDDRLPPLAWGRATILVPSGLAARMAPEDLRLIVRHEQAHLDRNDPLYFAALSLLDALLWFNPFLRAQTRRCRLAAELACDAAASGKSAMEREAYARVLIRTLKHTAGDVRQHAPAAISNVKSGDYRMRLSEIMHADPAARKPKRRWLYLGLAAALIPVAFVQFAWAQGPGPGGEPAHAPVPVPAAPMLKAPVPDAPSAGLAVPVAGPISEGFGVRADPKSGQMKFHEGVDFAVAVGTPVRAYADGKVSAVAERAGYGKMVEIDHGGGLTTRYAHLDKQEVAVGDKVKAGQVIATSGDSGTVVVGPHLHFEVWRLGKPINPANVLPKAE